MIIFLSIASGIIIVLLSLFLIRKEFDRAAVFRNSNFSGLSDVNVKQVLQYLDKLESTVEEMNQSFYDVSSDLEGKYSVHEKEIEILNSNITELNSVSSELSTLQMYQGKEIAKINKIKDNSKFKNESDHTIDTLPVDTLSVERVTSKKINKTFKTNKTVDNKKNVSKTESTERAILSNDVASQNLRTEKKNDEAMKLKEDIMRLKALGYEEQEIARELNRGIREIKMILSFI